VNETPGSDPFEILRTLNPIDAGDLDGERFSARAHEVLEQIVTTGQVGDEQQRTMRRRLPLPRSRKLYLIALVPVAAAVAAGAWALTHGATKGLTIGCYATASLQAHTVVVPATGESPTGICGKVWQRGEFGSPASPELQACVLPSGAVGVFPSPAARACEQLHLAPVASGPSPSTPTTSSSPRQRPGSAASLKDALVAQFLADACMARPEAISTVREELRKQHLGDWTVRVNGEFSQARPCASLGFDEEQHVVLLVPMPERP
jgi:hypothetical protein